MTGTSFLVGREKDRLLSPPPAVALLGGSREPVASPVTSGGFSHLFCSDIVH